MAMTYVQYSVLAARRGRLPEALAWAVRCVSLSGEIPHPLAGKGPRALVLFTSQLGMAALEDAWPAVTGKELPEAVRDYVADRIREEGDGQ
jgi:hypothetical protein